MIDAPTRSSAGSESELLPCPFCSGEPDLSFEHSTAHPKWWKVSCLDCGCRTQTNTTSREFAIERWNARVQFATSEPQAAQERRYTEAEVIAALKGAIGDLKAQEIASTLSRPDR